MNDPENFLARWSRKKSEEQQEPKPAAESAPTAPPQGVGSEQRGDDVERAAEKKPTAGAPAFDLSSLPAIDSIGPQTDVSVFMQPGVPSELRHAALRRAWSIDPAIRDFRGLQENDWDFNDPNGIPGFGPLPADFDVKKMVTELFGEKSPVDPLPAAESDQQVAQLTAESANADDAAKRDQASAPAIIAGNATPATSDPLTSHIASEQKDFVQCEGKSAPQDNQRVETDSKP